VAGYFSHGLSRLGLRRRNPFGLPSGDVYRGERAENYDRDREGTDFWEREQTALEEMIGKINLERNTTVLDSPIGSGRFLPVYQKHGFIVTGSDISEDILSVAQAKIREHDQTTLVAADGAKRLPFGDGEFDLVVSFRFLQYVLSVRDARFAISEFARVTKRWAVLEMGLSTEVSETLSRRVPNDRGPMGNRLTERQMSKMLGKSGFTIESRIGPLDVQGGTHFAFLCKKSF